MPSRRSSSNQYLDGREKTRGAAIAIRADRLVTGDRAHFGPLYEKTVEGVLIVSPQLMVAEMKTSGWFKPTKEFHAARHTLYSAEENMEIHEILKIALKSRTGMAI
jgi:hypothetical protein